MLHLLLILIAVVFLGLAAFGVGGIGRFNFGWGGLCVLAIAVWLLPALG